MERRELLKMIAFVTGGVLIGGNSLLMSCSAPDKNAQAIGDFTPEDQSFLNEVADTILPPTKTPGAKAAGVGPFMAMMVTDCYEDADRKIFKQGLAQLNAAAEKSSGAGFLKASPEQRAQLLEKLDQEARLHQQAKAEPGFQSHYFTMIKQLTLLGYFTSEIGCTQALRYQAVPGKYEGSVPYKKGDKAWA